MSYMTISSQEKHNFSLSSCFHAHSTTLLLKILGGPMHGRSTPPKNFGGTVPPSPPRSPPLRSRTSVIRFLNFMIKEILEHTISMVAHLPHNFERIDGS